MLVETRINILSFQNDEKFVTIFEKQLNVTVTPDYDPESIWNYIDYEVNLPQIPYWFCGTFSIKSSRCPRRTL